MKSLGIDFGDSRTGFAVSDELGFGAATLPCLRSGSISKIAAHAAALAEERGAGEIVLGYPKNMDGTPGIRTARTEELAEKIREVSGLPVILWDERLTTVSAHRLMNVTNVRGKKRKAAVDSISAAIILESYLDSKK